MAIQFVHQKIRAELLSELASYRIGDKLPSDRALAKRFNVAFMTINRIMKELEHDGYVARRQGKGTFLVSMDKEVYCPGANRTGTLLFAYPDHFSYEYWQRSHIAGELAVKNGIAISEIKQTTYSGMDQLLQIARNQDDLRGVLIDPTPGILTQQTIEELDSLGVPIIVFSHTEWLSFGKNIFSIVPDWFQAGYIRTKCLIDCGYKHLAFIKNEPQGQDGGLTFAGVKQALKDNGFRLKDLARSRDMRIGDENAMSAGYNMTKEMWTETKLDGIIYDSLSGAIAGARYLLEVGVNIPEDLGLVANGEIDNIEDYTYPTISTVFSPIRNEMEKAFSIVLNPKNRLSHQIVCPVELHIRGSLRKNHLREASNL